MHIYHKISRTISNMMLLALYLGFFFVQLTANFEVQNNNQLAATDFNNIGKLINSQYSPSHYIKTHATVSAKYNVRLNKRFFPAFFPSIEKGILSVEHYLLVEKITRYNYCPAIKDNALNAFSQRGPPVVA